MTVTVRQSWTMAYMRCGDPIQSVNILVLNVRWKQFRHQILYRSYLDTLYWIHAMLTRSWGSRTHHFKMLVFIYSFKRTIQSMTGLGSRDLDIVIYTMSRYFLAVFFYKQERSFVQGVNVSQKKMDYTSFLWFFPSWKDPCSACTRHRHRIEIDYTSCLWFFAPLHILEGSL